MLNLQPINMVYPSISLSLLQVSLNMFHGFQERVFAPLFLDLFLGVLYLFVSNIERFY